MCIELTQYLRTNVVTDLSIVPERLGPELTPELEQVRLFQKWGYLVVDDAITPEQVEILRDAMDDADARDTFGWNGEPNPGPYGSLFRELLEENDRFAFLLGPSAGPRPHEGHPRQRGPTPQRHRARHERSPEQKLLLGGIPLVKGMRCRSGAPGQDEQA